MPFYRCAAIIDLTQSAGRSAPRQAPKPDWRRSSDPDIPEWARKALTVRLADHAEWLLDREPPELRQAAIEEFAGHLHFMGLIWEDYEVPTDQGALAFTDAAIRGNNLLQLHLDRLTEERSLFETSTAYELMEFLLAF